MRRKPSGPYRSETPRPEANKPDTSHQRRLASQAYQEYLAVADMDRHTPGWLMWTEHKIMQEERSAYLMAAASCMVEAALYTNVQYHEGVADRGLLLDSACDYWESIFTAEQHAPNDLAELAKWNLCQKPTYQAVTEIVEDHTALPPDIQDEQETEFQTYFSFILERWDHESLDGHAMESLTSYFAHRSNKLRPAESPILSMPSPIREDHHSDAERRVDVDVFYLPLATKFGIQVKGGDISDPYANRPVKRRIFFNKARRALCIPATDGSLKRTIEAIVEDDPEHRDALDTIAADHRARLFQYFRTPGLEGVSLIRKKVQALGQNSDT